MLRYLFVLDVAFAVLGASMFIGIGVSALLLAWYLDVAPEQRESVNALLVLTLAFFVLTLASAAGALGIRRRAGWHWLAQAMFAASLAFTISLTIQRLAAQ